MPVTPAVERLRQRARDAMRAHERALANHARLLRQQAERVKIRTTVKLQGESLKWFPKAQRNALLRDAGQFASQRWIAVALPRRFEVGYARLLGYHVTPGYQRAKALALGIVRPIRNRFMYAIWNPSTQRWDETLHMPELRMDFHREVKRGNYKRGHLGWENFLRDRRKDWRADQKRAENAAIQQGMLTGALRPLVFSTRLIDTALPGARALTRVTTGKFASIVRIPTPVDPANGFNYGSQPKVQKILQALPSGEVGQWVFDFIKRIEMKRALGSPGNVTRSQRQKGAQVALPRDVQRGLIRNPERSQRVRVERARPGRRPPRRVHAA